MATLKVVVVTTDEVILHSDTCRRKNNINEKEEKKLRYKDKLTCLNRAVLEHLAI